MRLSRRRILTSLASLSAFSLAPASRARAAGYYNGPISDHFDGLRFFDPRGVASKNLFETMSVLPSLATRTRWPAAAPSPFADQPPRRVSSRYWRISFVGHASFLLQTADLNILIDPVWSDRVSPVSFAGPKRVNAPGIAFDKLPPIDVILVSHCHYDHLDLATLSRLAASHQPRVITPLGNDSIIRAFDPSIRVESHDWEARVPLSGSVAVSLAPMRHWSARSIFDRNKALWAAFVISTPAGKIYHVGDSSYGDGHYFREAREQHGPFRLSILPIGAYEPEWFMRDHHMNPADAVQAFLDSGAQYALAHHFGTFQLTNEGINKPVEALQTALHAHDLRAERFRALKPGQVWEL